MKTPQHFISYGNIKILNVYIYGILVRKSFTETLKQCSTETAVLNVHFCCVVLPFQSSIHDKPMFLSSGLHLYSVHSLLSLSHTSVGRWVLL